MQAELPARLRTTSTRRRPGLATLVGALVSLVSLAAVVWWAAHQEAPSFPDSGTGFGWLGLALANIAFALLLRGWRWHRIMELVDIPHRARDAYDLTLVGYMGNIVLPARGGEVLKIAILGSRTGSHRREIVGSVVAERLLDAGALVALFALLTSAGVAGAPTGGQPAAVAILVLVLVAAAVAVYLALRRRGHFDRFAAALRPFTRASRLFVRREGVPLAGLSVVLWLLDGVSFVLIARAIGVGLPLADGVLVLVLGSLLAAIPAAPGFAGTFDAGILLGLHAAGIEGGDAVGVLLLARFMFFVPVTVAGLVILFARYGGLHLRERRAEMRTMTPQDAAGSSRAVR